MVITYLHAKFQGQLSVGSKDRVEINGQSDGWTDSALPFTLIWSVININHMSIKHSLTVVSIVYVLYTDAKIHKCLQRHITFALNKCNQ